MVATLLGLAGLWLLPGAAAPATGAAYKAEIEKWHQERIARLTSDSGWLTLVGLFWLRDGAHVVGSDPSVDVVFPDGRGPARIGTLSLAAGRARFQAQPGVDLRCKGVAVSEMELSSDAGGNPDVLESGTLSFYLIRRGERLALRLKDSDSSTRRAFHGIDTWPADPKWRVEARFEPFEAPREIAVPTVYGEAEKMPAPGMAVFMLEGREFRLLPVIEKGETRFFFIFGDATNGQESYGACRFLYADPPVDGRLVLDFNESYNPPCAFTPFATCPLPPSGNRLPLRIEAGEQKYGAH